MTTRQAAILARACLATLVRRVPVRVINVSRAGCGLESSQWLRAGTTGHLRLCLDGEAHEDDVRIARCRMREGAGRSYALGAELLGTRRLTGRSIRLAIDDIVARRGSAENGHAPGSALPMPDEEAEQQAKGASRGPPIAAESEC